jgi:hypothetical protein
MKAMKARSGRRLVALVLASAMLLVMAAWAGVWILVLWGAIDAVW